jgi:hypothetical protein
MGDVGQHLNLALAAAGEDLAVGARGTRWKVL